MIVRTLKIALLSGTCLLTVIGCAQQSVITKSLKPPVTQIESLGEVDHPRALALMQERLREAGYQLTPLSDDQWQATHPQGHPITLTVNANNVVVTAYDAETTTISPTAVSQAVVSVLDVGTLPVPVPEVVLYNCKVTSGSGLKLRSESTQVVAFAKAGDVIENCEQITTNVPSAYVENKTLSAHIWGQGLYNQQQVLFAWKYVKPEGLE